MKEKNANRLIKNIFLVITILMFGMWAYFFGSGWPASVNILLGITLGVITFFVLRIVFTILTHLMSKVPSFFNPSLLATIGSLVVVKSLGFGWPDDLYYLGSGAILLLLVLLVVSWSKRKKGGLLAYLGILLPVLVLGSGVFWLVQEGHDPFEDDLKVETELAKTNLLATQGLNNPANRGTLDVNTFTYGSGTDEKRPEYAAGVRFVTSTVDASLLLPEWKGKKKKWREKYWGFGVDSFPLNARVYFPEGEGPFPLALIVHGNHSMIDYSDGGYAYLGELLASRGVITVSVDENFINGHWSGDFRGKEMPARAWLLLQHLQQWRNWTSDPDHELYQKADLDQIMLLGHSRGGEAVSIAAAFNKLPAYPDNALQVFDFDFGIKAVVSIAPTDYRYHRPIYLENVNYLSLQGSYDADEVSFWGIRPYRRLVFTSGEDWLKAGVYIHRANHGQFNSSWGRSDFGGPMSWLLNTKPLLTGEEQRTIAQVFISAFAEATLKDNRAFLPLFEDVRVAGDWLPNNSYLTHFFLEGDVILQDFEEDILVSTGADGVDITTQNLRIWREENLSSRDEESQQNNALVVGWNYYSTIPENNPASYKLEWRDSTLQQKDTITHLLISLAKGDFKELVSLSKEDAAEYPEIPLDLRIVLRDSAGTTAELKVSEVKNISPSLKARFIKLTSLSNDMIGDDWEVHLESFALPLASFTLSGEDFAIKSLQSIELIFDQTDYGVLVIDDLGWR